MMRLLAVGAGRPLAPLLLGAVVRREAEAQGRSPTLSSERVFVIVCVKSQERE